MLDSLLLKLNLMQLAKYDHEKLFAKDKDGHIEDVTEMEISDKVELIESFGEKVHEEFEEGGRWSNYKTEVYQFWHDKKHIYVRVDSEIPATEMQDGGDFQAPSMYIVERKKVETYIYE